jgi:protein-S-isoprenylcysteine O-methyltransferase Ste14
MRLFSLLELTAFWLVWAYPFVFRAPHVQKRESITVATPTRVGLFLECSAIFLAFAFRLPPGHPPGVWRVAASLVCGPIAAVPGWTSVRHLGRQFRFHAGLYHDHALVKTGPYAIVRHPNLRLAFSDSAVHTVLVDSVAVDSPLSSRLPFLFTKKCASARGPKRRPRHLA